MLFVYLTVIFSLNLSGISGIVTGLVPSIALSATSWYIKKRLQAEEAKLNSVIRSGVNNNEGSIESGESMEDPLVTEQ